MREILFRGKRTENDEWVEGVPYVENNQCFMITDLFICEEYQCTGAENVEVIPETVRQYTGLMDKNRKKIFEGDIVLQPVRETRKHSPCIIEFRNGAFMAHYKSENRFFDRYYDINSFTKIIGNIHDNPELLKGERI